MVIPLTVLSSVENASELLSESGFGHELRERLESMGLTVQENGAGRELGSWLPKAETETGTPAITSGPALIYSLYLSAL